MEPAEHPHGTGLGDGESDRARRGDTAFAAPNGSAAVKAAPTPVPGHRPRLDLPPLVPARCPWLVATASRKPKFGDHTWHVSIADK